MMEDLSLHILDIAENSIAAGATRIAVSILEDESRDSLTIRISDNGHGMSKADRDRALDPFFTTKKKRTGLGLPFLAQAAGQSGGKLSIQTAPAKGTRVVARFVHGHIDRPPLTKMAETMTTLIISHPEIEFRYRHERNTEVFEFSGSRYLRDSGATSWFNPGVIGSVQKVLRDGLKRIGRT